MIELILRVVLAIATNTACNGQQVDYYAWVNDHPDYSVPLTLSVESGDYWLMCAGDDCNLFHFAEPIADTIATGASHGDCFRHVE